MSLGMSIVGDSPQGRAQRLLSFVHTHKGVLNLLVHARPSLLEGMVYLRELYM
jgi:hypothetical protein